MKKTSFFFGIIFSLIGITSQAKDYTLLSPDKHLKVTVTDGNSLLTYSVYHNDSLILKSNQIGLVTLDRQLTAGTAVKVTSKKSRTVVQDITSPFYRFKSFRAVCNEMNLKLKGELGVIFRAYDEGIAYRFYTTLGTDKELVIANETAEFNFAGNYTAYLPYTTNEEKPMAMAYQATYDVKTLSEARKQLAFLPVTVDCGNVKVTLLESDLEAYPGMFVEPTGTNGLKGVFASYPKKTAYYPWRKQLYVTETENFIAKVNGTREYPWRILAITENDTEMPVNNLVYALASPNRIGDYSWVKPGKVAWEWWHDWNLKGVDFNTGINMDTYKY